MTSNAILQTASAAVKSAASNTGAELPAQSRSLQTADFERLLSQAQEQQAQVQLTNPVGELGRQNVGHVTKSIGNASDAYRNSIEASRVSLEQLDLQDPAVLKKATDQILQMAVRGAEMSTMMSEVSSARKSLGELFHMQG